MADVLDEAVIKLVSMTIRLFQLSLSIVILSCMAAFLSDLSWTDLDVPDTYVAVTAIAGFATMWGLVALLITCCAGKIILEMETLLDVICTALSITQAVLMREDALSSAKDFTQKYAPAFLAGVRLNRGLIKTSFGLAIVNIPLYASTSLLEWAAVLLRQRREDRDKHVRSHSHSRH